MKLVMLSYLQDDQRCVDGLLSELGVRAFSRVVVEGHGPAATGGWYGAASPYRSEMILVFAEESAARSIMSGVQACTGVEDPNHPIRAFLLDVEDQTACGCRPDFVEGAVDQTDSELETKT